MKRIISLLLVMVLSFSFVSELQLGVVNAETAENESTEIIDLKLDEKVEIEIDEPGETFTFRFIPEANDTYKFTFLGGIVRCSFTEIGTDKQKNFAGISAMGKVLNAGDVFTFTLGLKDTTATGTLKVVVTYPDTEVLDIESTVITAGTEIEINFTKENKEHYCEFVPEESGWYKYYSTGNHDIQGFIYDNKLNGLLASDNIHYYMGQYSIWGDFEEIYYFEAGHKYYLGSASAYSSNGTYKVGIFKVPQATDMTIMKQEECSVRIGDSRIFTLFFTPEDCEPEEITWLSSNTDVVEIDETGECYFKSLGTATITATSEHGLTDSLIVNVENPSEIRLNEEIKRMSGTSQKVKYTFIPEVSAKYAFNVTSFSGHIQEAPIMTAMYDKNYNLIASDTKWSSDSTLYYEMKKGECYYLEWKGSAGCILGEVTATVKLAGVPEYETDIDTTDELQQVGEEIASEDIKEIKLDEEKQIDITYFGASSIHKFIPAEDGEYKFTVTGNDFVYINVKDENNNTIEDEKNNIRYSAMQSPFTVKMEAGKTYIINSYISSSAYSGLGQYNMEINKLPIAEAITITNGDKIVEHIGYQETLNVVGTPEEYESEEFEWISSNESVAEVINGTVYLKNVGNATITVKSIRGLTDTIEVECIHHPEIECGINQSLATTEKTVTFTFIPEVSGKYNFAIKTFYDNLDLRGKVVKVPQETELSLLSKDFIDFEYQFRAGEIYYISVEVLSESILGVVDYSLEFISGDYEDGDVNRDGNINAEDALMVLKAAAKLSELIEEESRLADVKKDDVINADDALKILKIAAKIPE